MSLHRGPAAARRSSWTWNGLSGAVVWTAEALQMENLDGQGQDRPRLQLRKRRSSHRRWRGDWPRRQQLERLLRGREMSPVPRAVRVRPRLLLATAVLAAVASAGSACASQAGRAALDPTYGSLVHLYDYDKTAPLEAREEEAET